MIVGIMGDTHDNLPLITRAVQTLNEEEVELVLHTGDYVAPFVSNSFKNLRAKMVGVFGNNDGDKQTLKEKFLEVDAEIRGRFVELNIGNLKIAMLHGDEEMLLQTLVASEYHDVIIHGHTHKLRHYRKGKTLIINPGEVCGYLSGKPTVALFNTQTLKVSPLFLKQKSTNL